MKTEDKIFKIEDKAQFECIALDIFRFQAENCEPYKKYLSLIGVSAKDVVDFSQIPFLPIELYKSHKVYCAEETEELLFLSSGTTGVTQSRHYVAKSQLYIDSFTKGFEIFYAPVHNTNIYALLPNYIENKNSSLLYMVNNMIDNCADGEFFRYNHKRLIEKLETRDKSRHTLLFGVSFALLELAEKYKIDLSQNVTVMETGGMKGKRKEITRNELHTILRESFNVDIIHSEYGMCECLSQSYSIEDGVFCSPPWQKIIIRDLNNPFKQKSFNTRGGVNIVDLANIYSCSFIQTQDVGIAISENSFKIEGRIDYSDIRGCNLMSE